MLDLLKGVNMNDTNIININNQEVVFKNKYNRIFCTSLDVAKVFGKKHFHVLRDIENILNDLREIGDLLNSSNFGLVKYKDQKGELRPAYQISRDGFSLLAMGFTGKKALQWKIAFINAFNQMESIVKNQCTPKLENYSKYNIPDTPYREDILKSIIKIEKEHNCKVEELASYKIVETYKNKKINLEQKIHLITKGLI